MSCCNYSNISIFWRVFFLLVGCSMFILYKSGGPSWDVPKGRKDGRISKATDTRQLPGPIFNVSQLQQSFSQRGLSVEDLVALSGTNTIYIMKIRWRTFYVIRWEKVTHIFGWTHISNLMVRLFSMCNYIIHNNPNIYRMYWSLVWLILF